ncbi:hypothetical protein AAE478_002947 [Parahypoxylon ruwenzoriense]
MGGPLEQDPFLYNGVSNRSRGWKTKMPDKTLEVQQSLGLSVMRWDGASMSSNAWNHLKRDPELWHRDGNCYVHLYGQGHSRGGPAFKVPFSGLLEAKSYPLIDRFMARNVTKLISHAQGDIGDPVRRSHIELFIPAPPRSMVGESLGIALVSLMHSMHEFRSEDVDNVQDMIDYLDEEGYLNLRNNPTHALAILHLAEVFQLKYLYINSFAHCCGMSDQLFSIPEYQHVSPTTRKLIRRARVEMNLKLGRSTNMIGSFLQCELSEAHLGLYSGAQVHLQRFRTLLYDFYTARFGSYPPPSIDPRTMIFEVDVFRAMSNDFETLFQYLVDETFDTTHSSPFLAQGGICTWQSVRSFDMRNEFTTLFHPLPLLPNVSHESTSKRIAWLGKQTKSNQKQREGIQAALLRATNRRDDLLKNGLVRSYRRFEEDSVNPPTKGDKLENLGPMDGRKVRWILIYAMYQVLRQATEIPPEVGDTARAPYHLCISTTNLPPWDEERPLHSLVRRQTDHITRSASAFKAVWGSGRPSASRQRSIEIKPDIDYFALTHSESTATEAKDGGARLRRTKSWRGSFTNGLSRSLTGRRPSAKLTKQPPNKAARSANKIQYHEIIVQGYGNGLNDIEATLANLPSPTARVAIAEEDPALSALSRYSSNRDLGNSKEGSAKASDTSVSESSSGPSAGLSSSHQGSGVDTCSGVSDGQHDAASRQPGSSCFAGIRRRINDEGAPDASCGLMEPFKRRPRSVNGDFRRETTESAPANIRRVNSVAPQIAMPTPRSPMAWDHVQAVMEIKAKSWMANDVRPEWEQYTDVGGLTELAPPNGKSTSMPPLKEKDTKA